MADDRAYRILVSYVPESEDFLARIPELDVSEAGATRAEAITQAETALEAAVEKWATSGEKLPEPVDLEFTEARTLTLELAPLLLRDLSKHAKSSKMSLEQLATQLLSRGIGDLEGRKQAPTPPRRDDRRGPGRRGQDNQQRGGNQNRGGQQKRGGQGNRRGRNREGYRPELEDGANFMAYVRDQEKGGGRKR